MSDNEEIKPLISLVDSTHRISWEVTKDKFENCDFHWCILSSTFTIDANGKESIWLLELYKEETNEVFFSLHLEGGDDIYAKCRCAIKTQDGYRPEDFVKKLYSRGTTEWSDKLCTTEEFERYFVEDKVTIVASLVIYDDGDEYLEYVDNMRSISSQKNLTDFTIVSGNERFPCHRVILAVRSEYFEALFRNDPTKSELQVDEAPELVETMLSFISKGCIPEDIDDKAMDLILVADMYRLNLLTLACETSLMNNLTPDNALETLITIDKVKHVSKQKHRQKVLAYIKKEADQVVKCKDWKMFVQNYPDLMAEMFVYKCCKEHGSCAS